MINWTGPYQPKRDQYWPEVEQVFSKLPPHLFRQGVLLKNNLATFYADTGQFKDILRRNHDLPLLYLHFWLLDDLDCSAVIRAELEKHLFLAMTFTFAAVYTQECILDEGTNVDSHYLFLESALIQQVNLHLAHLFPGFSPFWNYHSTFWQEYAEAILTTAGGELLTAEFVPMLSAPQSPIPQPPIGKLAFTKIPAAAVAIGVGRVNLLPQLCAMLDRLNFVWQTLHDISTIRRDLGRHNLTYPLLRTMQEAGLDPQQPVRSAQLLGAMVLTGSIGKICGECLSQLDECRTIATSLNLPTFMAYFDGVEARVAEVRELFSVRKSAAAAPSDHGSGEKRGSPFFAPYLDTLPKVIEMAEGYLLSDLTFRESWEIQRRGVFGMAEMTGQAFPMGLIVEILCRHGQNMTTPLNTVFETLRATGFRYYDHPHLPSDADDLGLLLRLYPYSSQPEIHGDILHVPLRWLKENMDESGEIPVWLPATGAEYPSISLWGNSCATVEANVLLGLIDYDWDGYSNMIEKSAGNWGDRWIAKGLGATLHYVPLYSLWTAFELIAKLSAYPLAVALQDKLNLTAQILAEHLAGEANRPSLTPQDAAFLTLACLSDGLPRSIKSLFKPNWITLLCKSQRYDGSWAGEPLYGTPTRGELATWYSSRSVTTAFCYHALKVYQKVKARELSYS